MPSYFVLPIQKYHSQKFKIINNKSTVFHNKRYENENRHRNLSNLMQLTRVSENIRWCREIYHRGIVNWIKIFQLIIFRQYYRNEDKCFIKRVRKFLNNKHVCTFINTQQSSATGSNTFSTSRDKHIWPAERSRTKWHSAKFELRCLPKPATWRTR